MSPKSSSPIRVLHVTEASNAGVGGHVLDLMEGLTKSGCEVHFAYSPNRVDSFFGDRVKKLESDVLSKVPMRRMPHPSDVKTYRRLQECCRRYGPFDILHAHSTKAGILCRLGALRRRHRVVYTPNGIYSMNPETGAVARKLVGLIERRLSNQCEAVIAVSPEEAEHMKAEGLRESVIRMIPNGLRSIEWHDQTEVRSELGIDKDEIVFGFLGRLAEQKNPLLLLRAFALTKAESKVRLAIAGTGDLETKCRDLAKELKIDDRIYWLGYRTAPQTMPAFDAFVMPSRYEGMPYVMMEAMSLGLPVIATPVGGTSLAIENDSNGFVVPFDSPAEMAEAIDKLCDADVRNRMSRAALKKSVEFSVELMVDKTKELYQSILNR